MAKDKKRLRAKITVGHTPDGAPIIKYASGYSKRELELNKAELRKRYIGGAEVLRDILYGKYVSEWYDAYKKPNLSASSRASYATIINRYILPDLGTRQMRAITAAQLQEHVNGFAHMGTTVLTYIVSILQNTFRLAAAQGVIDRNPADALKRPKTEKGTRRALTTDETTATLTAIDTHPDGLLLAILYYAGLRRGEALGLRWSDIDFSTRFLRVERDVDFVTGTVGQCKTACSVRSVPIPDALLAQLQKHRKIGSGYVITAPRTKSHWCQATFVRHWRAIQQALAEAMPGIERGGEGSILTPHYYRHNYASILYNAGVDVMTAQKYLGHADPSTTMRIYTHLGEGIEQRDAERARKAFL